MAYILVAVVVIVAGIGTTAIINVIKNREPSSDIRARAGTLNTLKLSGVVREVKPTEGIITVDRIKFSDDSRSGPETNYGLWTVAPPREFDFKSIRVGNSVEFTVETTTFNVASKSVVATYITIL